MTKDDYEAMRNYERLQRSIYVSNYLPDMYAAAANNGGYNGNFVNPYDMNPILREGQMSGRWVDPYSYQSYQLAEDENLRRAMVESMNINIRPSAPPHPPAYSTNSTSNTRK
jgi:hypothetical protein